MYQFTNVVIQVLSINCRQLSKHSTERNLICHQIDPLRFLSSPYFHLEAPAALTDGKLVSNFTILVIRKYRFEC
jgi:hypothetical protein